VNQSGYRTRLHPLQEQAFQLWFRQMRDQLGRDLDPEDPTYDMRGFWQQLQMGGQGTGLDPGSGEIHFPDTFKTPQHPTMSAESRYAPPGAPTWNEHDILVDQTGTPTMGYIREMLNRR
jgi:hypothetical protein